MMEWLASEERALMRPGLVIDGVMGLSSKIGLIDQVDKQLFQLNLNHELAKKRVDAAINNSSPLALFVIESGKFPAYVKDLARNYTSPNLDVQRSIKENIEAIMSEFQSEHFPSELWPARKFASIVRYSAASFVTLTSQSERAISGRSSGRYSGNWFKDWANYWEELVGATYSGSYHRREGLASIARFAEMQ